MVARSWNMRKNKIADEEMGEGDFGFQWVIPYFLGILPEYTHPLEGVVIEVTEVEGVVEETTVLEGRVEEELELEGVVEERTELEGKVEEKTDLEGVI